MRIREGGRERFGGGVNELKQLRTFGCFQPLLFDTVADLGLGLAFGEVTFNNRSVAFVHLDLMLVIGLKIPQL